MWLTPLLSLLSTLLRPLAHLSASLDACLKRRRQQRTARMARG